MFIQHSTNVSIAFSVFCVKCFLTIPKAVNKKTEALTSMSTDLSAPENRRKDVFHAFLVKNANYAGNEEIPCIIKRFAEAGAQLNNLQL